MIELALGDLIQTRKKHPCGSDRWVVIRVGADIKIKCKGCGRIVMLERQHPRPHHPTPLRAHPTPRTKAPHA